MKKLPTFKYGPTLYIHKGIRIQQSNLEYIIWQDFVTPHWSQLRASTLDHARMAINGMVQS